MDSVVAHNDVHKGAGGFRKRFGSPPSYAYTLAAKAFSEYGQYALFGEDFFFWPLSLRKERQAAREWLYQQGKIGRAHV